MQDRKVINTRFASVAWTQSSSTPAAVSNHKASLHVIKCNLNYQRVVVFVNSIRQKQEQSKFAMILAVGCFHNIYQEHVAVFVYD